jgi:hypothetical protein
MADIIRSWLCLNARCRSQFDAWDANPACPKCECVRVQWVPGGGHVAGSAKAADAELRALADCFKLGDINSARRDERAKPALKQPPVDRSQTMQFAPGFASVPYARDAAGKVYPVCQPSAQDVSFKVRSAARAAQDRTGVGPGKLGLPNVQANTTYQARHSPRTG